MKHLLLILAVSLALTKVYSQSIRVAILDFENISGIAKYDGLGKAMSSMLISDIEANVSPKRLQLVERAQIQKVLKEQKFQTSVNVNKNSAVQAGKILGVNYLLVGDIYILNDQLIINARLTNTETGDIVFSKKQEGKLISWLNLKTNIAKNLAQSLSQPFIEPTIPDKEVPVATITTFGNAVTAKDTGNVQLAEALTTTILDFSPDFKYVDDLREDINKLKIEIEKLKHAVDYATDNPISLVMDFLDQNDVPNAEIYFEMEKNRLSKSDILYANKALFLEYVQSLIFQKKGEYQIAVKLQEEILKKYPFYLICRKQYLANLIKIKAEEKYIENQFKFIINTANMQTSKIADTSSYKHEYIGNGVSDQYVISLGYNDWIDIELTNKSFLDLYEVAAIAYFKIKNFDKGEKYFNEALKFIDDAGISFRETSLLTSLSWLCVENHRCEYAIKVFNKFSIDVVSGDLMSVINFAHNFLIIKEDQKAKDLYCWAIQNNYGRITDIRNVIIQDHLDLNIKSTINLNCQEKMILTKTDKSIKFLEDIINSNISFKNGESEIEFTGTGEVILKQNGDIIKGIVYVDKNFPEWIKMKFENSFYLEYFTYGYERNDYAFKMTEDAKYIIPVSNENYKLERIDNSTK